MALLSDLLNQVTFEEFQRLIEELTTTEGRLAVSVGLLVLTVLVAVLVAPRVIRWTGRKIRQRFPEGRTANAVDVVGSYIPTTISGFIVRVVQLVLLGSAVIALLVVWGLVDIAVTLLQFVGVSLPLVGQMVVTGLIFLFAYIAADLLQDTIKGLSDDADRITDHQQEIVTRVGNLSILVFAVTAVLTLWGLNLSGLLVGAGFLGIVVGMAARQTLGSMIAGFVLMFSRPFTIGDWVEIGEDEGIVTDITIMNTRMRNFDGESIIIPNDNVSNEAITNRSERGHLRIRTEVGIDYEADPEYAAEVALEEIEQVQSIADSPPPAVVPTRFGDSAIILEMRFWINRPTPPRKWRATRKVIHRVKKRFEEEGIKIPYPQRELSGRNGQFQMPETKVNSKQPSEDVVESQPQPETGTGRED